MLLAQITDLHMRPVGDLLLGRIDTKPMIEAAVAALGRLDRRPDAVVITGDLVDLGTPEEYALLRAALAPIEAPIYVIPGNHDEREAMRAAFSDHAYLPSTGPLNWAVDLGPVRLIGVDSVVPQRTEGDVSAETLAWLDDALSADARPTIVAIHHPPFRIGPNTMDGIRCLNGDAIAEVVSKHGHVERVICGHHHRAAQIRWAGTIGSICPSVAHQVAIELVERPFGRLILEPPAFQLHWWADEVGLSTHTLYVDTFGGPISFAG